MIYYVVEFKAKENREWSRTTPLGIFECELLVNLLHSKGWIARTKRLEETIAPI